MKNNGWRAALLAGVLLASASCIWILDEPWNAGAPGVYRELHRLIPFEPRGSLAVQALDGDIEVRGWDRNEVEITAESERGYRFRAWGWAGGQPVFDVEEKEGSLEIRTRWEGDERDPYPVHFYLNVPRSIELREVSTQRGRILIADCFGKIKVSLLDGDLIVENFSGSLDARVTRGDVEAEVLDLRKEDEIKILSGTGDITLLLESEASARIEADATEGIDSEWPAAPGAKAEGPGRKATLNLGRSEASVVLKTARGRIALRKTE